MNRTSGKIQVHWAGQFLLSSLGGQSPEVSTKLWSQSGWAREGTWSHLHTEDTVGTAEGRESGGVVLQRGLG